MTHALTLNIGLNIGRVADTVPLLHPDNTLLLHPDSVGSNITSNYIKLHYREYGIDGIDVIRRATLDSLEELQAAIKRYKCDKLPSILQHALYEAARNENIQNCCYLLNKRHVDATYVLMGLKDHLGYWSFIPPLDAAAAKRAIAVCELAIKALRAAGAIKDETLAKGYLQIAQILRNNKCLPDTEKLCQAIEKAITPTLVEMELKTD